MTKDPTISGLQKAINQLSDEKRVLLSDGYHSFKELYDHRCLLYVYYINSNISLRGVAWKSLFHHDMTSFEGWFISGFSWNGEQISYHLPIYLWDYLQADAIQKAPEWDGHTSQDVVARLKKWLGIKE